MTIFPAYSVEVAGDQWVGRRENQEDCFLISGAAGNSPKQEVLAILADGMGGAADGELASGALVQGFARAFSGESAAVTSLEPRLRQSLMRANQELAAQKADRRMDAEAGATLIALSVDAEGLGWLSVGDSLLYRQSGSRVTKLNQAHTWGMELRRRVQAGIMTAAEAEADQNPRHALYSAVCGAEIPLADYTKHREPCKVGDRFIIASDGLQPLVDNGWESILNDPSLRHASPILLRDALLTALKKLDVPRQDNATVIVVDIKPHPDTCRNCSKVSLLGDRDSQQDSEACWQSPQATLAVVADGAGGHAGGEFASRTVVHYLHQAWQQSLSAGVAAESAQTIISAALQEAHRFLIDTAGGKASLAGKSTVVAVYLCDQTYTVVNVGDSRVYISEQGEWKQLSVDDSLVRIFVERGMIAPDEVHNHPDRGRLSQAIGASSTPRPHLISGQCPGNASFLLCCDGLWDQLPAELWDMSCWPASSSLVCDSCLKALAEQAVEAAAGKSDNVSAIWLRPRVPSALTTPSQSKLLLPVIGAAALILCGAVGLSAFTYMSSEDKVAAADKRAAETLQRAEAAEAKNAEMERRIQEERKAREEAEKKLQEQAPLAELGHHVQEERKRAEEAARKELEEAERRVREKAERRAKEEAERLAREEAELRNQQKLNNPAEEQSSPQTEEDKPVQTAKPQEFAPSSEAEPPVQDDTPPADSLHDAARHGNVKAVESLLRVPNCDVNRVDHHMSTPLHLAATYGHVEVVKRLLDAPGIEVNKADKNAYTPLKLAMLNKKTECAELIRKAGGHE